MRACFALLFALSCCGCGITWRPSLVVSCDLVHASRTIEDTGVSASRWDARAQATLVLTPRPTRPVLMREERPRSQRVGPPCIAAWLCAWERASREEALAGVVPALLDAHR